MILNWREKPIVRQLKKHFRIALTSPEPESLCSNFGLTVSFSLYRVIIRWWADTANFILNFGGTKLEVSLRKFVSLVNFFGPKIVSVKWWYLLIKIGFLHYRSSARRNLGLLWSEKSIFVQFSVGISLFNLFGLICARQFQLFNILKKKLKFPIKFLSRSSIQIRQLAELFGQPPSTTNC